MKKVRKIPFTDRLKKRPIVLDVWTQIWKMKVIIIFTIACLVLLGHVSEVSKWAVYPYVLSKLTMLVILWRIVFKGLYPYSDLSAALSAMDPKHRAIVEAVLHASTFAAMVIGGAMMI